MSTNNIINQCDQIKSLLENVQANKKVVEKPCSKSWCISIQTIQGA